MLPLVFQLVTPRSAAADLAGTLLHRLTWLVYLCVAVVAVTTGIKLGKWEDFSDTVAVRLALLGAMTLAALINGLVLEPALRRLRQLIAPLLDTGDTSPFRTTFRRLHGLSMLLGGIELGCGISVFFFN